MTIQEIGALCFGIVVGWLTYFTMRHKKNHAISDIATVIGAIGGAAVLKLFPANSLFGWYAIGLAIGFFVYFFIFFILVALEPKLTIWHALTGTDIPVIMGGQSGGGRIHPE